MIGDAARDYVLNSVPVEVYEVVVLPVPVLDEDEPLPAATA